MRRKQAQVDVGLGELPIGPDRLLEQTGRLLQPVLAHPNQSEAIHRFERIWPNPEHSFE